MKQAHRVAKQFAICVSNKGYQTSLEKRKIYQLIPDADATQHHQVRVIDESGEDYLYPEDYFIFVDLPIATQKVLLSAA